MGTLKIRKTILSDSIQLVGLAQFQGQEVEISISPVASLPAGFAPAPHSDKAQSFMRFADIAATEAALLQDLEAEIELNRDRDLHRQIDL